MLMNLRPAVPGDKPAIIELLKSSLGDSMIPKSTPLWNWKHEQNPFGQSFVLLAEENGQLIGVRAFMQWTWRYRDQRFQAIRAVDTATHPDHQGKGIFKKLTLRQLELCEKEGIGFVFNTPNEQSRPGYLKMGWQQQGKLPLKLKAVNPLKLALRILLKQSLPAPVEVPKVPAGEWEKVYQLFSREPLRPENYLHADITASYIRWRYAENPLFNYGMISDFENYVLLFRPKDHARYRELRITDFVLFNDSASIRKHMSKQVLQAARQYKADIISMSGNQFSYHRKYFGWMGLVPVKPFGPIVTIRKVSADTNMELLMDVRNWQFSLGDLELF